MEVETLIPQMQDILAEIRTTVNGLSTKAQDDKLDQLEQERECLLAELQASFESERQELETKRQLKLEAIKKKRKQEDDDRAARRRQEDQELEKTNFDEDTQRQNKHDSETVSIEDETGKRMDEIEEVVRKMIQEGKQKLHGLDEKRRELDHLIDEQLKSLPTTPSRNRGRPEKGHGATQKNDIVGDYTSSIMPRIANSSSSKSNKRDTPLKLQPQSTNLPGKPPEAKKDGELSSQRRSNDRSQVSKDSAKNLPGSFAEALKKDVSNGSKGKSELGKPSINRAVQTGIDRSERRNERTTVNEFDKPGVQIGATVPIRIEDVIARRNGAMTPTETTLITREQTLVENIESSSNLNSQLEPTRSRGRNELSDINLSTSRSMLCNYIPAGLTNLETTMPQQNQSNSQIENANEHGQNISKIELKRRAPTQRPSDQLHTPVTHDVETKQRSKSLAVSECSEVPQSRRGNLYTPNHLVTEEPITVELQSSRLSTASQKRNPRENDKETYNQVGFKQPASPDILEQYHPGGVKNSSSTLKCLRAFDQFSQVPAEPILPAPRINIQGELIAPLSRGVSDLLPGPGNFVTFDKSQNMTMKYFPIVGEEVREVLASPLPVENETVHGQDLLFEDNKNVSGPEPHISDEHSGSSPIMLTEGQYLPSGPILAEETDEGHSRCSSSKVSSTQEVGDFDQRKTKIRAGSNASGGENCSKLRSKVNITEQSTRQDSSPITPASPNHVIHGARNHNGLHPNNPSRNTSSFNRQWSNYSQPVPLDPLHDLVLSGVVGSTPRDTMSSDPADTNNKLRSNSVKPHPKRIKQRGRPRNKSVESPERALNPRELLFRGSEDEIDIRSTWFKNSKRGLSQL